MEKRKEIPSVFRGNVKRKVSHIFNYYENDKDCYIKPWVEYVIDFIGKRNNWGKYITDKEKKIWLEPIPNKDDSVTTSKELENLIDNKLIPYVCYLASIFEIDYYFSENDKMKGWLPLFIDKKQVSFYQKMMGVMSYDKFITLPMRKIIALFNQIDAMLESINRNIDDERIQSDIANSIVVSTTVMAKTKPVNVMSLM